MFDKARHESGVGDAVGSNSTAAKGVKQCQSPVEVPTAAERAEDDVVGLEVGGDAAAEGAMGEGREEGVRVGEAAGAHEGVEERVVGADARVAAEEGGEPAEGGERGVGHERAGEGGEDNEGGGLGEARAAAEAREEAEEPREAGRGGGGEAAQQVEEERLRRGVGRPGGDEELQVRERGGGVGVGLDELEEAVDGRRPVARLWLRLLVDGLRRRRRRRHQAERAVAACARRLHGRGKAVVGMVAV